MSSKSVKQSDIREKLRGDIMFRAWSGPSDQRLLTVEQMGYYFCMRNMMREKGWAYVVILDKSRRILNTFNLKMRGVPTALTVTEEIDRAISHEERAKYFLIVHNHKGNPTDPSIADILTTNAIIDRYKDCTVKFIGHCITSDFDYTFIDPDGKFQNKKYISKESLVVTNDKNSNDI